MEFHVSSDQLSRHNYSLDESDATKRNSLLQGLVQLDISKGYVPAAMISAIRGVSQSETRAKLITSGGAYLSRQDIINSGTS